MKLVVPGSRLFGFSFLIAIRKGQNIVSHQILYNMPVLLRSMPRIKIRPVDMARIHKNSPPAEYGRCQFRYCGCPEYQENPASEDICGNCYHNRRYHVKNR